MNYSILILATLLLAPLAVPATALLPGQPAALHAAA